MLFLEHKKTYRAVKGDVPDASFQVPIGVADVKREGDDLSVITYGYELHRCLEAAQRLQDDEGVSVEVVDVRTIAPLDVETILASVRKTSKAMVVYEDNRSFGAGAEIAATIAEEAMFDLDAPIVRIGGPDIPRDALRGTAGALLRRTPARPPLSGDAGSGPFLASFSDSGGLGTGR